jgi:hypothetical protein
MFPLQMDEGGHEWGSNVKLGYNPMLVVFRMYPSCHCLTKYVSPLTDDSCTSHQQHFCLTWRSQGWCQGIVSGWFVCPVYLILTPASWGPRLQNHGNCKGWPRLRRIGESVSTSRSGDIGNGLTGHKSEARLLDNSRPSCISSSHALYV